MENYQLARAAPAGPGLLSAISVAGQRSEVWTASRETRRAHDLGRRWCGTPAGLCQWPGWPVLGAGGSDLALSCPHVGPQHVARL